MQQAGGRLGSPVLALRRQGLASFWLRSPRRASSSNSSHSRNLQGSAVVAGALAAGIAIGIAVPTQWFQSKTDEVRRNSVKPSQRENSAVYEDVREIAEDIPRPAIIVDATRGDVEAMYEFHSCLASGGSATVWRATELATGRPVAIKVVDKKLLQEAFLNMEVASLRRCAGHPNIMQLLAAYDVRGDAVCPDGEWHLVMELAEGGELFERLLAHGAYSEKVASQLLRQVARAIYHLHSCGIVHRDIKPENIVLMSKDADSPVKLIDFGAAVLLEENEQVAADCH
jgi:serine/threonine protein kinase